jgi:hypothetical protein
MILQEGSHNKALYFEFSEQWIVCKYDDHTGFYHKVQKCQGMKAIDFLATDRHELLWIEVKNFRDNSAENSPRLSATEPPELEQCRKLCHSLVKISRKKPFLVDEVVKKVCDTFTGLAGAFRHDDETLLPYVSALAKKLPLTIVLFLHQDKYLDANEHFKPLALRLKTKIKQQLRFLNINVEVVNEFTLSENADFCFRTTFPSTLDAPTDACRKSMPLS